jgi:hypothetical protein
MIGCVLQGFVAREKPVLQNVSVEDHRSILRRRPDKGVVYRATLVKNNFDTLCNYRTVL